MKIVSSEQIAALEKQAYSQGFQGRAFMEKAGEGVARVVEEYIKNNPVEPIIWILCGKGNNAGDAFVAGRYLLEKYDQVIAIQLEELKNCSELCQSNAALFQSLGGKIENELISFGSQGLIIDGIFGTGFKGEVKEPYSSLIHAANASKLPILAIDIASGLNGSTGECSEWTIHATETIFLGLPKLGFFLKDGWLVSGKLKSVNFGLPDSIIANAKTNFELITSEMVSQFLPSIKRNRHKYQTGSISGLAGSLNMPGAALLACLAAFRGGGGIVYLHHPEGMESILSASFYELIKVPYSSHCIVDMVEKVNHSKAVFVGPGLARSQEVQEMLKSFFENLKSPVVIDAEGLRFLADHLDWIPKGAILTPHLGEMQYLLKLEQPFQINLETLSRCQQFSDQHEVTLVLKGAPTFIFHPHHSISINPTGDPGMATAGSGDVLTGLLAALLAQGLTPHHAALLGVYLHGLSGEIAAKKRNTSYGMMAKDLIDHFADAYFYLEHTSKN